MLLLTFPELKDQPGKVSERLKTAGVTRDILAFWSEFVKQKIKAPKNDGR